MPTNLSNLIGGANFGTAVIQCTAASGAAAISTPGAGWYSLSSLGLQLNYKTPVLSINGSSGVFTLKAGTYLADFEMHGGAVNTGQLQTILPSLRNLTSLTRVVKFSLDLIGESYGWNQSRTSSGFTITQDTTCDINIWYERSWTQRSFSYGEYGVGAQLILQKIA